MNEEMSHLIFNEWMKFYLMKEGMFHLMMERRNVLFNEGRNV